MKKLAAPYVARGGRAAARSVFMEGASIPPKEWREEVKADPALASSDRAESNEAIVRSLRRGALAKYRGR